MKPEGRMLVLGAHGMVGRMVFQIAKETGQEVVGTHHQPSSGLKIFKLDQAREFFTKEGQFQLVVNCIGKLQAEKSLSQLTRVNTKLPKMLEKLGEKFAFNLVHISTDAVYGNLQGEFNEAAKPQPDSDYAKSKLAGEVSGPNSITLRTSIIGLDPIHGRSLLSWALSQQGEFYGYTNQFWSGCTNIQLARLIMVMIKRFEVFRNQAAVFHFAPLSKISKFELLKLWLEINDKEVKIKPNLAQPLSRQLITKYTHLPWPRSESLKEALCEVIRKN